MLSCYKEEEGKCTYHFDGCCQHVDGNVYCEGNGVINLEQAQDACSHDYDQRHDRLICWKCGYVK